MAKSYSHKIMKSLKDKRSSSTSKNPAWKLQKSDEPDAATYDVSKSLTIVKPSPTRVSFTKSQNKKFSVIIAQSKEYIPSSAHYKKENCYDAVYRPYVRTRIQY